MIRYVDWNDLVQEHLVSIANSMLAAPCDMRLPVGEILTNLRKGIFRCFSFGDGGLIVVSKGTADDGSTRLMIECFAGDIWKRADLAADLKRLAADWECDTIETLVFDPRLARAIERVGGRVKSYLVTLAVEGQADGRR